MGAGEDIAVTTECAWPYSVQDAEAKAVCRIFYNLSPEERTQVLTASAPTIVHLSTAYSLGNRVAVRRAAP